MEYNITLPFTDDIVSKLKAGDIIKLSGTIYTARDAAHKRLADSINAGEALPFELQNSVVYYVGPTPSRDAKPIGSCGPTTSYRMDSYSPLLLDLGQKAMIGKGKRSSEVKDAIVRNHALYLGAIGGAGAYLSKCVITSEVIAYEDLGSEAIRKLTIKDFPLVVLIDSYGSDLYDLGRAQYLKSISSK
ncbi:MAG: Fe-S-containing hydro-lyase [Proteocatella sp.]